VSRLHKKAFGASREASGADLQQAAQGNPAILVFSDGQRRRQRYRIGLLAGASLASARSLSRDSNGLQIEVEKFLGTVRAA
jgi:hypothetical protein